MEKIKELHYNPALPTSCNICIGEKVCELITRVNTLAPSGIVVLGKYDSAEELPAGAGIGDAYFVGSNLWVWGGTDWEDCGEIKGEKGDPGEKGNPGEPGDKGDKGDPGNDGFSPTVTATTSGDVLTLTIVNKDKTETVNINVGGGGGSGSAPAEHTHYITDIIDLPNVAKTGSYNDLTDKPTIPDAYTHPTSHPASMITGLANVAKTGSYTDLSNKPDIPAAYVLPVAGVATLGGLYIMLDADTATLYISTSPVEV